MENNEKSFKFLFTESEKVGHSQVDSQHQQIMTVLASLAQTSDPNEFEKLYHNLIEYCTQHFADEESIMASHSWTGLANHKEEHVKILEKVWQYRPTVIGFIKSQSFIQTIFGPLIIGHDREFSTWVRKKVETRPYEKQKT